MTWKFECIEESPDQCFCTGVRDSGHTVRTHGGENEVGRALQLAFELEVELGTDPRGALFQVARGAKPNWFSRYDDHAFGSWLVESNRRNRIVYDGKDHWLAIYCGNEEAVWQGAFSHAKDLDDAVFQLLATASA
jgi:hypothetical protein